MRKPLSGTLVMSIAAAMLMACGGDDNGATSGNDASFNDSESPAIDGSMPGTDGKAPGIDGGGDGRADGGCNFATFVKGLVANDTTMTASPSTDLGQGCTDNRSQAEFKPLFP